MYKAKKKIKYTNKQQYKLKVTINSPGNTAQHGTVNKQNLIRENPTPYYTYRLCHSTQHKQLLIQCMPHVHDINKIKRYYIITNKHKYKTYKQRYGNKVNVAYLHVRRLGHRQDWRMWLRSWIRTCSSHACWHFRRCVTMCSNWCFPCKHLPCQRLHMLRHCA